MYENNPRHIEAMLRCEEAQATKLEKDVEYTEYLRGLVKRAFETDETDAAIVTTLNVIESVRNI